MHLRDNVFRNLINSLLANELLNREDLTEVLDEFDGIEGVVKQSFYISAYEELGRYIAKNNDIEDICIYLDKNRNYIFYDMEEFYYFVESIVDFLSANNKPFDCIYLFIPESYKLHLNRIFK